MYKERRHEMSKLDELLQELRECAELADKNAEDYAITADTHRAYAKALHAFAKGFKKNIEYPVVPKSLGLAKLLKRLPSDYTVNVSCNKVGELKWEIWRSDGKLYEYSTLRMKAYLLSLPEPQ